MDGKLCWIGFVGLILRGQVILGFVVHFCGKELFGG